VDVVSIKILLNMLSYKKKKKKEKTLAMARVATDPSITLTGSDGADGRRWWL
jgi:hypothetical protein